MLEKFLREPTLLTDDDVMELLTFIFQSEAAQKKLDTLIERRRKTLTTDGGENPLFNKGAIIHRLKVVHCVPESPLQGANDFHTGYLLLFQSSSGRCTSPALAKASYPFYSQIIPSNYRQVWYNDTKLLTNRL